MALVNIIGSPLEYGKLKLHPAYTLYQLQFKKYVETVDIKKSKSSTNFVYRN